MDGYETKFNMVEGLTCLSVCALADAMGIDKTSAINTIKKGLERYRAGDTDSWKHFPDPKDSRRVWISYDHLPHVTQLRVDHFYGNLQRQYYERALHKEAMELVSSEDFEWFHALQLFSIQQSGHLAEACGWLRLISPKGWWRDRWDTKSEAMQAAVWAIQARDIYGLRVSSPATLYRRVRKWQKEGRRSLVSKKFGNNNAGKVDDPKTVVSRLIDLYASPLKPTFETVTEIFNREATDHNWPQYTVERVRQILNKPDNMRKWIVARHGVNAARALTEGSIKRKRPEYPDQLWSVDGTTVQLYSADGKQMIKEWYYVVVVDAHSDCVIGRGLGATEKQETVLRALKQAVSKSGKAPRFIQFDASKANLSDQVQNLLKGLKTVGIKSQPYNGKGKYVERVLGRIEQGFMRHLPNFVGGNVTAPSLNSKANPDLLKLLLKSNRLPNLEQIPDQLDLAIDTYNNTVIKVRGATPEDLYAKADERRRSVEYLTQVSLFWIKRRKPARYTKDGLLLEIDGNRIFYEVQSEPGIEDYEFRKHHLGDRFWVRYDPECYDEVNLYDDNDRWMATAGMKHEFDAIPTEGNHAKVLRRLEDRKRYLLEGLLAREDAREEMEALGAEELNYEMIHKDALNRSQNELTTRLLEESAVDLTNLKPRQKEEARKRLYNKPSVANRLLEDDEEEF